MTCVRSLSRPGRILGRASRIVTWVPRSLIIEANSQPITPPPMIAARFGHLGHREHLVGGHHDLAVHLEAGEGARQRPGGEHDGVGGELEVARLATRDRDLATCVQPAVAVEHGDLATLQHRAEPTDQAGDDRVLAGQRHRPVERSARRR